MALSLVTKINPPPMIPKKVVLEKNEKIALITDLVVAVLLFMVGSLSLIQRGGLGDLGSLSCLGSMSSVGAFFMVGAGILLPMSHLLLFAIRESRYLSRLNSFLKKNSRREQGSYDQVDEHHPILQHISNNPLLKTDTKPRRKKRVLTQKKQNRELKKILAEDFCQKASDQAIQEQYNANK
ncbi:MAG: hypothetical protein R3E91_03000 [Chlamydiales bacterium]